MKIIVSGWPGCGSTTLSLILTKMINLKLYKGSETFRYFSRVLETGDSEEDMVYLNKVVQPEWGPLYDRFIKEKFLSNSLNILVDSDITSCFVGPRSDILSIFLHSNIEVREAHLLKDNREKDAKELRHIDSELNEKYAEYLNFEDLPIDFDNIEFIKRNYNFVLDNSELLLDKELEAVFGRMKEMGFISEEQFVELLKTIPVELQILNELGKKGYEQQLKEMGMVITAEDIIKEIRKQYPNEVANLSDRLREEVMKVK